jgi:Flp pilus assembly protein TadG
MFATKTGAAPCRRTKRQRIVSQERKGAFVILALICLTVVVSFAALSVDFSRLSTTRQKMQNACDAAALAAAMEVTSAIETAGPDVENVFAYAKVKAREKAQQVAALNGIYINPEVDVEFGNRQYNEATGQFEVQWNQATTNLVKVHARKVNPDRNEPDAVVSTPFAAVIGRGTNPITTTAAAYVEARDIVSVLDFSRSMNFDSHFTSETTSSLTQGQVEDNLQMIWDDLGNPTWGNLPWYPSWVTIPSATWGNSVLRVEWRDTSINMYCQSNLQRVELTFADNAVQTFNTTTSGWQVRQGTSGNSGKAIKSCRIRRGSSTWETFDFYNDDHIRRGLGLTSVAYPWPSGSWSEYFQMCRNTSSGSSYYQAKIVEYGFGRKFGAMTLLHYVLRYRPAYSQTPDLWKTRHYPFHSVKEGQKLLCDFLEELSYNDYVGMVSYDTNHRVEHTLSGAGMPSINISSEPVTNNYQAVRDLIHYKQAAHYASATNIGGGLKSAKALLDAHGRPDARPTILLMTDGQSNTIDSGEDTNLPGSWNWDALFDYDGDGTADYTTTNTQKRYVLKKAKECVDSGYTIHTMVVGDDGDRDLMRAIAYLGRGIFIDIPSGTSVGEMEAEVREAFNRIASFVPPATLLSEEEMQ